MSKTFTAFVYSLLLVALLASHNANGQTAPSWVWARQNGGNAVDQALGTATDAAGNVYQTGSFTGRLPFGAATLLSSDQAMYLAKYDARGNVLWAVQSSRPASGSYYAVGITVAADAAGNVYVSGYFSGTLTWGSVAVTAQTGRYNAYIVKFNSQGVAQWAVNSEGSFNQDEITGSGLAIDATGNVFASGFFYGAVTFGGVSALSQGGLDAFLLKINATGIPQWIVSVGGSGVDYVSGLALSPTNGVYMSGGFSSTASFGSFPAVSQGGTDVYLTSFDAQGTVLWARSYGGTGDDSALGLAVAGNGDIYNVGFFEGTATFGSTSLVSAGREDAYLMKCNSQGLSQWVSQISGTGSEFAYDIAISSTGIPYVMGGFEATAAFGSQRVASAGGSDIFIARYTTTGASVWATRCGGVGNDQEGGIACGSNGAIFISGQFATAVQCGPFAFTTQASIDSYLVGLYDNVPAATVASQLASEFSLYPNPVGPTGLTLALPEMAREPSVVEVIDLAGRIVQSQRVANAAGRAVAVPTAGLAAGQYLLRYQTENTTVHKRFVVL